MLEEKKKSSLTINKLLREHLPFGIANLKGKSTISI